MNDVDKILAALDSLMQSKGAGEGIIKAAQLGDVTARSLVNKAARDIDKLQEMTGPKMYQAIEDAEINALAERAGVSAEEMQGRINTDDVKPKVPQLSKEEFYAKYPNKTISDEELFLSNILKDQKGVARTVDEVFDNAFVYGVNKLGLSQEEAKTYASGIIGKITTPEQHTPAGPELQAKLNKPNQEAPSIKKVVQQVQSTPIPFTRSGRYRLAGRVGELLIPLLAGSASGYLLTDALDVDQIKKINSNYPRMPGQVDTDMATKIAAAELAAQAVR